MTKQVRHRQTYQFKGERYGKPLVSWLNGNGLQDWDEWVHEQFHRQRIGIAFTGPESVDAAARRRVGHLLDLVHDVTQRWVWMKREFERPLHGAGKHPTEADLANLRENKKTAQEINLILRRYRTFPQISLNEPYWEGEHPIWFHGDLPFLWAYGSRKIPLQELWAVQTAGLLLRERLLDRVRRCNICKRFFFAVKDFQLYCSAPCRAERYTSVAYKNWRRKNNGNGGK